MDDSDARIRNILFEQKQNKEKRNLNVNLKELTEEVKCIENAQRKLKVTYNVSLDEYVRKSTELKLTKDTVSHYNIVLRQKQKVICDENQKLDELHYKVWDEEDKFCEDVWKFSGRHNFCAHSSQDPRIVETLRCERKPRVDFEKDILQNAQVRDLVLEINALEREIQDIAVNADITKQSIKRSLSEMKELKDFSEQNIEILRLTNAFEQSQRDLLTIEAEIAMEMKMQEDYGQINRSNGKVKVLKSSGNYVKSDESGESTTEHHRRNLRNEQIKDNYCIKTQIGDTIGMKKPQIQSLFSVNMTDLSSKSPDKRSHQDVKVNLNLTRRNIMKPTRKSKDNIVSKNDTNQLSEFTTAFTSIPSKLEFETKNCKDTEKETFPLLKKQRLLCDSITNNKLYDFVSAKKLLATSDSKIYGNNKQQSILPLQTSVESRKCVEPMLVMPGEFKTPMQNVNDKPNQQDYNSQLHLPPSPSSIVHEKTKTVEKWGKYTVKKQSIISMKLAERRQFKVRHSIIIQKRTQQVRLT